jgi:hypothetical protein
MSSQKKRIVALKDIQVNLFVRTGLNQDRVIQLAELIEAGVPLEKMEINQDNILIDGRHRKEAYELNNVKEVEVVITETKDETDLITRAFRANLGGALPPTRQDTEHTIMMLLDRKVPKKEIGEHLNLPTAVARNYITNVQSRMTRAKVMRAAQSVTEGGLTVAKAAEQHDVDPEKLKEALSGGRSKNKRGVDEIMRNLTLQYKSVSQKNASMLRSLLDKFTDGDVSLKQATEIFDHVEKLQRNSSRSVSEWRKRLQGIIDNGKDDKKP